MAYCQFPAVVIQDENDAPDDGYDVVFPDFPGCVSSGDSVDAAISAAEVALALHVEGMKAANETVPSPGASNRLPAWLENAPVKVVAFVTIPAKPPALVERG